MFTGECPNNHINLNWKALFSISSTKKNNVNLKHLHNQCLSRNCKTAKVLVVISIIQNHKSGFLPEGSQYQDTYNVIQEFRVNQSEVSLY